MFFRQTINDIQNRHEMFLSLEKSITELHDMFLDIAQLIESQGEMVNRIGTVLLILFLNFSLIRSFYIIIKNIWKSKVS